MRQDRVLLGATVAAATVVLGWALKKKRSSSNKKHEIPAAFATAPHQAELKLAVKLALQCGRNMIAHCDSKGTEGEQGVENLGIEIKGGPEDFCTAIDLENEEIVIGAVRRQFPSHEIIGEESTGTGTIPPLTSNPTWIIDPIDGTTNFASGLPLTCVSIGFCVDKVPVMGCVYAPMTDELYLVVKGYGAYRNGVKLWKEATHKKSLKDAIVDYEFGYSRSEEQVGRMVKGLSNVLNHGCRATRILGSGVLDLCYVATGRLDVVYAGLAGEGWKPWDYAAGSLVATEAGCAIESLMGEHGKEFDLYSESVVCATHIELLQECREVVLRGLPVKDLISV